MRGQAQFSFWISITLVKICFSSILRRRRKNTFELLGTALKIVKRTTAICAVKAEVLFIDP